MKPSRLQVWFFPKWVAYCRENFPTASFVIVVVVCSTENVLEILQEVLWELQTEIDHVYLGLWYVVGRWAFASRCLTGFTVAFLDSPFLLEHCVKSWKESLSRRCASLSYVKCGNVQYTVLCEETRGWIEVIGKLMGLSLTRRLGGSKGERLRLQGQSWSG